MNQRLLTAALITIYVSFFFCNNVLVLSIGVCLPFCFLILLGVYWTQKMNSVISSLTLCPQRSVTGWLLPSHGKWGWCSKGLRKSPGSGVLSMQCKLGYLWKGKVSCNYFVLVTTQVLQISPVVCDGTITGGRVPWASRPQRTSRRLLNEEHFNVLLLMFLHRYG